MSENQNTLQEIKTLRDELKVKAHLLEMEAKQEWDGVEQKWEKLNNELAPVKDASIEVTKDILAAHKLLREEIVKGYRKIKNSFKN